MDSALRPRDIQARIRAGESPEQVAAAAQTTLDKVMAYATPVLAERAHIAERAQKASVRRRAGEGPARMLSEAVAERLVARNVNPESVEWDSWRREDGRWTLVADYRSGESSRHAEFVFDAPGRYVVADDDEARWLVGEQTPVKGPQPRTTPGPRRLSAVGSEDELPLGEDAIELVAPTAPAVTAADETEDLSATAAAVRATGEVELGSEADEPEQVEPEPAGVEPAEPEATEPEPDEAATDEAAPDDAAPRRTAKKKSRASVPSWDEIMFGGKRE